LKKSILIEVKDLEGPIYYLIIHLESVQ